MIWGSSFYCGILVHALDSFPEVELDPVQKGFVLYYLVQ